jgi:hypothetical protein
MCWKDRNKAWIDLQSSCNKTDEELFTSTVVNVGNGRTTSFWKSSWIHDQAPNNIAPSLFKKTRKKNIQFFMLLGPIDGFSYACHAYEKTK